MRVRPFLVRSALPPRVRGRLLTELELLTAQALGAEPPASAAVCHEDRLRRYAQATAAQARALDARDDAAERAAAAAALRAGARELGARTRRLLHVRGDHDALETLCAFYHHIGIEARCAGPHAIEVRRCRFAAEFTPATCGFIAALDDGFAAGLAGGGHLVFSSRITEGGPCCRARLEPGAPR